MVAPVHMQKDSQMRKGEGMAALQRIRATISCVDLAQQSHFPERTCRWGAECEGCLVKPQLATLWSQKEVKQLAESKALPEGSRQLPNQLWEGRSCLRIRKGTF